MDVPGGLQMHIQGFAHTGFTGSDQKGTTNSFFLGNFDFAISSQLAEHFSVLSELTFEPDVNNDMTVDLERMLLVYSANDHLQLSFGRSHTSIGYYNTAYHHSTWLQTTTERPFLFAFEDQGGILPIHTVGVSASGQIPSGKLGLHYVAEVGNGRESRSPLDQEPVENIVAEQNHKAYNFAVFARPEAVRGVQAGFSIYRDLLDPITQADPNGLPVQETILAAHAVYIRPSFEFLNEALVVRHTPQGGHLFQTPGFYSQISKRFGSYRPYFRYEYVNGSDNEPIFPDVGHREGPSAGLRYDASEFVALKLQYDYRTVRDRQANQSINGLTMQLGFTF